MQARKGWRFNQTPLNLQEISFSLDARYLRLFDHLLSLVNHKKNIRLTFIQHKYMTQNG